MNLIKAVIFCFLLPFTTLAQTTISGVVKNNNGEAIVGANVYIKGTYDGISTDAEGAFSFSTNEKGEKTIVVSFVGHTTYEELINLKEGTLQLAIKLESTIQELDVVTISAGSIEASDEKKSVILRPLDIVTTAGASGDIYGALQTLPGAQIVGNETGLFVRGGDASESKTIIDGTVVRHPFYSKEPDINQRGRFSPFLFKGTVFSTGGYSAEFGQAMSSALILESQDLADATSTSISLMSVGGGAGHEHRWKNTSFGFDAFYANLGPYFSISKQNTEWIDNPVSMDGSFILRQKTSKTGLFKIYGNFDKSHSALYYPDINNLSFKNKFELDNQNLYANASFKEILNKKWSLQSGMSFSKNVDKINLNENDIRDNDEYSQVKIKFTRQLGKLSKIRFGGEAGILNDKESYNNYERILEENYTSGFSEVDVYLSSKLVVRAGGRFENSSALKKRNIAPRTSLALQTSPSSQLSFAYGKFYQTPEDRFLKPNSSLGFENATHYILNYQTIKDKRSFRFETYYKKYNNLVKYNPDTLNSGNGFAKGIDIFWRDKKTFKYVDYWLSYSYLDTERDYRDYEKPAMPTFAMNHTFTTVFKQYIAKINCSYGFTYSFATGRPYYNPNNPDFLSDRTPNYHNLSINFSYLTMIKGNFTVFVLSFGNVLGINNIYGYYYSDDGSIRSPIIATEGRSFFVGMFMSIGRDEFEK